MGRSWSLSKLTLPEKQPPAVNTSSPQRNCSSQVNVVPTLASDVDGVLYERGVRRGQVIESSDFYEVGYRVELASG